MEPDESAKEFCIRYFIDREANEAYDYALFHKGLYDNITSYNKYYPRPGMYLDTSGYVFSSVLAKMKEKGYGYLAADNPELIADFHSYMGGKERYPMSEVEKYCNERLGLSLTSNETHAFWVLYLSDISSEIRMPILKYKFVEQIEDLKIYTVYDYNIMKKAILKLYSDGRVTIGNIEKFHDSEEEK
ncbi:hypothetical protein [Prevotella pallens]